MDDPKGRRGPERFGGPRVVVPSSGPNRHERRARAARIEAARRARLKEAAHPVSLPAPKPDVEGEPS